ncbi:MAG: hypothetical protein E6J20_05510 [Chloroflexi bacterium]|nr:MAG: hypothetical protein E6J20_05510 [Chloroflexota bacterium]
MRASPKQMAAIIQRAANLCPALDKPPLALSTLHVDPNRDLRLAPIVGRTSHGLALIDLAAS